MMVKALPRPAGNPRALRRQGWVPAVIYGPDREPLSIVISEKDLLALFDQVTRSTVVEVALERGSYRVFIKDMQVDPLTNRFLHVDFYIPKADRSLVMPISVKLIGEAPGVREGGILEQFHDYIEVEALPDQVPAQIEVDISHLGQGDAIAVGDLQWGEGVQPLLPPTDLVVAVFAPTVTVEEVKEAAIEEVPPAEAGEATG